ncbi:hypothetical protein P691DRAFT_672584 [Macrolepiota fuliginosa MF-IS2]|uniref:Uncharacterized protein n=1 Tax=Macrolepiota fuliginosa MF-IS2 TaxID=1400762 RepID=A0A9P6C328_9AGAR|nr:hypothetical protein P691DRAFT_672584 [Macrolepiota fuliginosa MF-IS2]
MNTLEKCHSNISINLIKLETLAFHHPFTQQIDVIFPSECTELEGALTKLYTKYARGKANLAQIFTAGPGFVRSYVQSTPRDAASQEAQNEDVWCIDTRGILTLCACKETYERLGLVGQKMPFKHQSGERYVISLPLHENTESTAVQARRRNALESWDMGPSPQEPSNGVWDVVYCSAAALPAGPTVIHNVDCEKTHLENIWIPSPISILPRPQSKQEEELEDWEHDVAALFEWVGMAGFHAQRLQANDRVDPFVALYEPPSPNRVGNVSHLRWRGLLSPTFVQSVIDASVTYLQATKPHSTSVSEPFVAITAHGITNSPVVYLPQPRVGSKRNRKNTAPASDLPPPPPPPAHLPRRDGEDTRCLILTRSEAGDVKSILVEAVGQWDARWG